jgi:gas vesicle protein
MAIPKNMKGISDFLAKQRELIDQIQDTAEGAGGILSNLFDQLRTNKENAEKLVEDLKTVEFQVGDTDDVKARQRQLLKEIEEKEKDIQDAVGDLQTRGQLKAILESFT